MEINHFFDKDSNTFSYIVHDEATREAAVIDPVFHTIEVKTFLESKNLHLKYILETHIHADHVSGARNLKRVYPNTTIVIHENISHVHKNFESKLGLPPFSLEKSNFDLLIRDNDELTLGAKKIKVIATPGHTPACVSYLIGDSLFTGDAMFMPDFGSGRCDFPGGSAESLYNSIHQKLFSLPNETKVFVGHDYGTDEREIKNETTIKEAKSNYQLGVGITKEEFVKYRTMRDENLQEPKGLKENIKANLYAGRMDV